LPQAQLEGAARKDYYKSYFAVNDAGHIDIAKTRKNSAFGASLRSSTNLNYLQHPMVFM
jgi:hypothetical protein